MSEQQMAPPKPCPQPAKRAGRLPAAGSSAGALPEDVLSDILLRLQAKELCRLRAVCRALTSEPLFIREHAARHRDPLFLANPRDDPTNIHVLDLSGNVLKRIPNADGHQLLPTRLDLAGAATVRNSCRVIDPAIGRIHVLPESPAAQHLGLENLLEPYTSFAFGRIADTGEHKVLRMFSRPTLFGLHQHHLFEVFTISGGSGSGFSHVRWRARGSLDEFVEPSSAVVVGCVVYFKVDTIYEFWIEAGVNPGLRPDCIISFDLEMEEWRGLVQGPISGILFTDEYDDHSEDYRALWSELTLAAVGGRLVLVHYRTYRRIMDLWFLEDFDNSLWVKEYSIQTRPIFPITEYCVKALFMLDDGRLVVHFAKAGLLIIYDPRTNTSAQVEMRPLDAVAMYTGNLLSL